MIGDRPADLTAASRPLVIGHRGASGYRPEHTESAYRLAFEQGADAVEPDLVATRDGVLVIRHENEISGTTDVARRPEFADRRATKVIDGQKLTGWFTEDFDWDELATLRAVERLPKVRPASAGHDGAEPMLRLVDLLRLVDECQEVAGRMLRLVAEIKHAHYFASIGLPLDELFALEIAGWDAAADRLIVESFEQSVLTKVRERGVPGRIVYLIEADGAAPDLVARDGVNALSYAAQIGPRGLPALVGQVDGVSLAKSLVITSEDDEVESTGAVERISASGLDVFTWTLRAENRFLTRAARLGGGKEAVGDWRTEFRAIYDTGVAGVFADQPDLAVAVRDEV
ncbi:glycerophosphodiester phosphodiesterase family protein [Schumannella sp. 10F1B-5-1]|uniref:glycerophosphodiester phosphodiesterase family protein n=1 Tax=Schumannella sp. 10F1B-5-1 TaxID=2590780 RepID=UPI0021026F71|nr:glycerophosphodiester phosphodiesterase family protein [Schumannella sp. 10F1B-5-1]